MCVRWEGFIHVSHHNEGSIALSQLILLRSAYVIRAVADDLVPYRHQIISNHNAGFTETAVQHDMHIPLHSLNHILKTGREVGFVFPLPPMLNNDARFTTLG